MRLAGGGEEIVLTGSKASPSADRSAPPPPPPPTSSTAADCWLCPVRADHGDGFAGWCSCCGNGRRGDDYERVRQHYRYFLPVFVPTVPSRDQYDGEEVSPVKLVANEPVSTFSVDVDTGAYTNARRFISEGQLPPKGAVRTEEFVNYFRYDYDRPDSAAQPFTVNTDVAVSPWNADARLVRIGLAGYEMPEQEWPAANLVFLLDVSGSMYSADKLPLVKTAMRQLAGS